MKTSSLVTLITLAVVYLMVTGFQCGSAESTSAKLYMQRKEWDAAEQALVKEVENNPANTEAWYYLGQVRLRKAEQSLDAKDYAKVKKDYENMVYAYGKSMEAGTEWQAQINTERLYAWQKALNSGVELFNLSLKATGAEATSLRGQAVGMYDAAILVHPDSLLPYKNAAIALATDGQTDRQLTYLKEAKKISSDPEVMGQLVQVYIERGDAAKAKGDNAGATENYNLALAELTEARKVAPGNADLLNASIDLYIKTGRAEEAIPLMEEGLRSDPNNKDYHYNLGVLLMQAGRIDDALTHFDAALAVDPAYAFALQNAGSACLKVGDEMKRKAQANDSKDAKAQTGYVEYFKKAASYFERLTKVKPDDPNAWDFYASAAANAGMLKEAEAAIKQADKLRNPK
jgi:tetratricopeptide (TPR) repeat protein